MDTNFEPIFTMQSTRCQSQTHKVFKLADDLFINVVDCCQVSGVQRLLSREHSTLKEAFDAMVRQFAIDEEDLFE